MDFQYFVHPSPISLSLSLFLFIAREHAHVVFRTNVIAMENSISRVLCLLSLFQFTAARHESLVVYVCTLALVMSWCSQSVCCYAFENCRICLRSPACVDCTTSLFAPSFEPFKICTCRWNLGRIYFLHGMYAIPWTQQTQTHVGVLQSNPMVIRFVCSNFECVLLFISDKATCRKIRSGSSQPFEAKTTIGLDPPAMSGAAATCLLF